MKLTYEATMDEVNGAINRLLAKQPDRFKVVVQKNISPNGYDNIHTIRLIDNHLRVSNKSYNVIQTTGGNFTPATDYIINNNECIDFLNERMEEFWPTIHIVDEWDTRMLRLASSELNTWSKDPSTKVSAAVFRGKYPIAMSYNGFPPGIADSEERLQNRELKYKLVQHAEANAIATCAKLGIATEGCTMSVTHHPCSTCAGQIISAGIKKVIVQKPTEDFLSRWTEQVNLAQEMFSEAGVELVIIDLDKT